MRLGNHYHPWEQWFLVRGVTSLQDRLRAVPSPLPSTITYWVPPESTGSQRTRETSIHSSIPSWMEGNESGSFFFFLIWLCRVLVAAHGIFSWGMQDLLAVSYELVEPCGIQFPDQGSNPGPLLCEPGVLATGPPGESWKWVLMATWELIYPTSYPLWNVKEEGTGSGSHPDTRPEAAVTLNIQKVRRRQRAGSPSLNPQGGHGSILELSAWVVPGSRITEGLGNALISKSAQTSVP